MDDKTEPYTATPFEEALTKTGNGLYNVLLACTCAVILLAIGVELLGFSLVTAAACDLNLTVAQMGILTSLPFIGIMLGSFFWGYIADTRGRRFTLLLSLGVGFTLSSISCLSPHWIVLGVIKFLSVCFSCAANSVTYTLLGESCIQRIRSKYMLMMTCLLILSPAVASALAYPTLQLNFAVNMPWLGIVYRPWRLLIIIHALLMGVGGIAIYFFHESPKFLANWGRTDEALAVLKAIHAMNHRTDKDEYTIQSLTVEECSVKKNISLFKAMYEQSVPLFRPPYAKKTLQLFYIVAVVYLINNTFLMWLPYILNLVKITLDSGAASGNICTLISSKELVDDPENVAGNTTETIISRKPCRGKVETSVILTLIASQCAYALLNFVISYLAKFRKAVLIAVLCLSALGGAFLNVTPEPKSSVFMYVLFTSTCLGMGILASYFVDLYPTSYRGMVACLSIMVGRSSAFVGINAIGNQIFSHCHVTFYILSAVVFSSVIVAWFLPPDKSLQ